MSDELPLMNSDKKADLLQLSFNGTRQYMENPKIWQSAA